MKRSIVFGLYVFTALLFLMYAFIQKAEADKQRVQAENQREIADSVIHECNKQRAIAEEEVRLLKEKLESKESQP